MKHFTVVAPVQSVYTKVYLSSVFPLHKARNPTKRLLNMFQGNADKILLIWMCLL